MDKLMDQASPEQIAKAAERSGCKSVAFTYNDPVIFMEYAIDVAKACREKGIKSVAVTAGYMNPEPRREFYQFIDGANVDLKGFTQNFYRKICAGDLDAVLDTLIYLKKETDVWFEVTTLLIPGENDSDEELEAMTDWYKENLGCDVPLHFTAFHPDWKMLDRPATPIETLLRAREIALRKGLRYVYAGNIHHPESGSTYCLRCGANVVTRDWYEILSWSLDDQGRCRKCGYQIPGRFEGPHGTWGRRRQAVEMGKIV
jgi:pyruvate formate lyase activating enzyme